MKTRAQEKIIRSKTFCSPPSQGGIKGWVLLLLLTFLPFTAFAQEVRVTVNSNYNPMPPAAMSYADNPGRYFTVTLQNTTGQPLTVFLGIELEKQGDITVSLQTPVKFSPSRGVVLPAGGIKTLTTGEMKQLFTYMKLGDVSINGAIMSDFTTGKQPLLPEGFYTGRVVAYEVDYQAEFPRVLSDPGDGRTNFWICYNAKAPQIVSPNTTNDANSLLETDFTKLRTTKTVTSRTRTSASERTFVERDPLTTPSLAMNTPTLDPAMPQIAWMAPQQDCSGRASSFRYTIEIARLLNGRSPEEAMNSRTNIILTRTGLLTTKFDLPTSLLKDMMLTGGYFVARVRAVPATAAQNNMESNQFVLVENNGYSPLCVFKVEKAERGNGTGGGTLKPVVPGDDGSSEDEKEDSGDDEEKQETPAFLVGKPHLKTPQPSIAVDTRILHTGDSICMEWEKPQLVKGEKERYDKLTYKYNVRLYKYKTCQPLDSMLVTDAIYKHELKESDLKNGLRDTIRWKNMEKALERSEQLYVMVDATIENDGEARIDSTDQKNLAKLTFLKTASETFGDCNPGYSETISDKTLCEDFTTQNMKDKEVKIGEFTMVIDEIELTEIKSEKKEDKKDDKDSDKKDNTKEKAYKGTGYVKWKPYGGGFKIAVEFDSLWINANHEVYRGKVRSARDPKALDKTIKEKIPYDMFDDLDLILGAGKSKEYADKYADKLAGKLEGYYKVMNDYADMLSLSTSAGVGTLQLPVALPRTSKDNPVSIQLFSAEFSPNTAWINVFAQMQIPECSSIESNILAFTAPHICISPDAPLTDGIASLMGDFTFKDPKTNFGFTFRAPSQFDKPDDGTWVSWSTDKATKEMQMDSIQVQIEMSMNGLLKDDGKGGTVKGEVPVARMQMRLMDWGDWIAKAEVDPFQSSQLPGYTFDMTNGGMWYDHSSDRNPKGMKLPKDKGYEDKALKDDNQWQGFWLKKAQVQMPFDAEKKDDKKDDKKDSSKKTDKKRVSFSIDELFVDKHGFTVDFNVNDVGSINESGWSISLDHAYARVVQNSFKHAGMKGVIDMPVFDDSNLPYEAKMSYTLIPQHFSLTIFISS